MKFNFLKYLFLLPAFILALQSCRDDDNESTGNINIEIKELGYHDTKGGGVVHAGEELHLDAEITTTNKINNINVSIAKKSNTKIQIVNEDFADYKGQLSADFHKHIDIPANTTAGDYVVNITVTDLKGVTKTETADLKIEAEEKNNIIVELDEVGYHDDKGGNLINAGASLHLDGQVSSPDKIENVTITIQGKNATTPAITEDFSYYKDKSAATFHEHITIPMDFPVGDYIVTLTVKDKAGKTKSIQKDLKVESKLFDFTINNLGEHGHGHIGEAFNLNIGIKANQKAIKRIRVGILHPEITTHRVVANFTKYDGQTNATFNENIDIPSTFPAGKYNVIFITYDENNKSTIYEKEVEFVKH